jgi:hypothetical protein
MMAITGIVIIENLDLESDFARSDKQISNT